eukprot:GILK01003586.1.p1 GENE.GILK01003586.1~~GILK01003586.1.p1  ORF type:complete len:212 (-),score=10.40 GILK01003586.1:180-758(-)
MSTLRKQSLALGRNPATAHLLSVSFVGGFDESFEPPTRTRSMSMPAESIPLMPLMASNKMMRPVQYSPVALRSPTESKLLRRRSESTTSPVHTPAVPAFDIPEIALLSEDADSVCAGTPQPHPSVSLMDRTEWLDSVLYSTACTEESSPLRPVQLVPVHLLTPDSSRIMRRRSSSDAHPPPQALPDFCIVSC